MGLPEPLVLDRLDKRLAFYDIFMSDVLEDQHTAYGNGSQGGQGLIPDLRQDWPDAVLTDSQELRHVMSYVLKDAAVYFDAGEEKRVDDNRKELYDAREAIGYSRFKVVVDFREAPLAPKIEGERSWEVLASVHEFFGHAYDKIMVLLPKHEDGRLLVNYLTLKIPGPEHPNWKVEKKTVEAFITPVCSNLNELKDAIESWIDESKKSSPVRNWFLSSHWLGQQKDLLAESLDELGEQFFEWHGDIDLEYIAKEYVGPFGRLDELHSRRSRVHHSRTKTAHLWEKGAISDVRGEGSIKHAAHKRGKEIYEKRQAEHIDWHIREELILWNEVGNYCHDKLKDYVEKNCGEQLNLIFDILLQLKRLSHAFASEAVDQIENGVLSQKTKKFIVYANRCRRLHTFLRKFISGEVENGQPEIIAKIGRSFENFSPSEVERELLVHAKSYIEEFDSEGELDLGELLSPLRATAKVDFDPSEQIGG